MANENINIDIIINAAQSAKTLKEQKQALNDISKALNEVKEGSGAFELLTDSANELRASMDTLALSFEDVYGEGVQPLTTQLGELEDRMYAMARAGQQNTDEFRTLQEEAIKMRRTIQDVDETVDAFAQRGARLKGFIGIAQGIAGAFATAKGALSLFGVQSENVEKTLASTAAVLEVLSGLEAVSTALKEKNVIVSALQNGIRAIAIRLAGQQAVAEAAAAAATGTATIAQRALNAAMAANPIGLLITAVVALTTAFAIFGDEASVSTEKVDELNNAFANSEKSIDRTYKKLQSYNDALGELSNATIELDIANIDKTLSDLESIGDKTEAEYRRILKLNEDRNALELKLLKQNQKNREISVNAEIKNEQNLLETKKLAQKAAYEIFLAASDEEKAQRKKEYNDAVNDVKDIYNNIQILQLKKKQFTILNGVEESKLVLEQSAEIVALTRKTNEAIIKLEEDKRKKILDNITETLNRNKEASQDLIELKAEEIKDLEQKELELQRIKFQGNQQALIDKAIERELKANDEKYANLEINEKQYFDNRLKIEQNGVNNLLESEKELYDFYATQNESRIKAIKNRFATEKNITVAETKKLNAELALLEFEYGEESKRIAEKNAEAENKLSEETKKTFADEIKNRKESLRLAEKALVTRTEEIKKYEDLRDATTSTEEREAYQNVINDIIEKNKANEETIQIYKKEIEEKLKALKLDDELYGIKSVQERKKNDEAKLNAIKESIGKEKKLKEDLYNAEVALLTENKNKLLANESLTAEERLKIEAQYNLDVAKLAKNTTSALGKEEETRTNKLEDENEKRLKDWQEFAFSAADKIITLIGAALNRTTTIRLNQIDVLKEEALKAYDEEVAAYWGATEKKTNAEKFKADKEAEFARKREELEKKYDKLRAEAEYKNQLNQWRLTAVQAASQLAFAIIKAAPNPFLIATTAALGALELGIIQANKPVPPKFAKGGLLQGPSHAEGGIATPFGEMEGGEAVINKKSTAKFLPILSAINEAGGGVPLVNKSKMATGGVTNINNNNVDMSGVQAMLEAYFNRPIKTYVTSSDVTNAQGFDKRLRDRTSF